jgi:hypothetical protein
LSSGRFSRNAVVWHQQSKAAQVGIVGREEDAVVGGEAGENQRLGTKVT